MDPLRLYLLGGLLLHKLVWEVLKRRGRNSGRFFRTTTPLARAAKLVKIGILAGILVQTLVPDVLPILAEPAWLRRIGAALFTVGLGVAIGARVQLGDNWSDIEAGVVQPAHRLVTVGIYRWVRHPIYAGDLVLLAGLELALNSWLVLLVPALAVVVYRQTLKEEQALAASLPGYADYCRRTRRFVPFLF
jgi:protein-S-isoprenylcysteine O-methyltransferase Ste14